MKTTFAIWIFYIGIILIGAIGYVLNAAALVMVFLHNEPITTLVIGRIVGLFIPFVGAVLGYF